MTLPSPLFLVINANIRYTPLMFNKFDIASTIVIGMVLTLALLFPIEKQPLSASENDKLAHLLGFSALAFPLAQSRRIALYHVFIVVSIYGGVIELIQPTFNRTADIYDWLYDMIGAFLGICCGIVFCHLKQLQPRQKNGKKFFTK